MCRPSAITENSRRTREKPLVPQGKVNSKEKNSNMVVRFTGYSLQLLQGLSQNFLKWGPCAIIYTLLNSFLSILIA